MFKTALSYKIAKRFTFSTHILQSMTTSALKSLLDSATATPAGAVVAKSCRVAVVSEVGASVYSVSALADAEYPGTCRWEDVASRWK